MTLKNYIESLVQIEKDLCLTSAPDKEDGNLCFINNNDELRENLPWGGELPLRENNLKGAAGATPPGSVELQLLAKQKSKSWSSSFPESSFTSSFGHPEEWHMGKNLPHRNSKNLIQSITFRLADSMPQNVLRDIEEVLKKLPDTKREIEKRKELDRWLDRGLGCCALGKPEMAQVVWDALQFHNGDKYKLLAWSIMPNHVHVLIETEHDLSKIVQSWKSYTGRWAIAINLTAIYRNI